MRPEPLLPFSPFAHGRLSARTQGAGDLVVCLHSSTGTHAQWHTLAQRLSSRWQVLSPDLYGHGRSPQWPAAAMNTLHVDGHAVAALMEAASPQLDQRGVHLVGHSYGAAIALKAALMHPTRVRSLTVYEPTIFALVDRDSPRPNATEGIQQAVRDGVACLERGDAEGAARAFIDFWMGEGSFDRTPVERRGPIVEACRNVRRWAFALMNEPATLEEFRQIRVPVLYMVGGRSPESSRSVAERLVAVLADVRRVEFLGLGHMGPVKHPQRSTRLWERCWPRPSRRRREP